MEARMTRNPIGRPPGGPPTPPAGSGLTVLGPAERPKHWRCRCECGNECDVRRDRIASGKASSCGCRKRTATATARAAITPAAIARRWVTRRKRAAG